MRRSFLPSLLPFWLCLLLLLSQVSGLHHHIHAHQGHERVADLHWEDAGVHSAAQDHVHHPQDLERKALDNGLNTLLFIALLPWLVWELFARSVPVPLPRWRAPSPPSNRQSHLHPPPQAPPVFA